MLNKCLIQYSGKKNFNIDRLLWGLSKSTINTIFLDNEIKEEIKNKYVSKFNFYKLEDLKEDEYLIVKDFFVPIEDSVSKILVFYDEFGKCYSHTYKPNLNIVLRADSIFSNISLNNIKNLEKNNHVFVGKYPLDLTTESKECEDSKWIAFM